MCKEIKTILEQKEEELKILHQAAKYMSSYLNLNEMLTHIVEMTVELTNADSCLIYIFDANKKELVLMASKNPHADILGKIKLKLGEGLTGKAAEEKRPVAISSEAYNDPGFKGFVQLPEDKYEAFLSVPILSKDEVVGVINIQHKDKHDYPEYQVGLLFTVAKYLGSAVQNALSAGMVQKKDEQIDVLSKISQTITSNSYLNEILQLIVVMTAQIMNSKICSIMLIDEQKQELIIAATQSLSNEYKNKPSLKVGQSVSGKVVRKKSPITVVDVTKDKDYMYPDIARNEGIVSMLAMPMMIKDRVIGVINSYTDEEHRFSVDELNILQVIANQAAVAIENTRLNKEIFEAREELETRKILEKAKGILMKDLKVSEEEAYKKLQKKSMDMRKSMRELAEAVILASDMKSIGK